jgi:hypothetical protein
LIGYAILQKHDIRIDVVDIIADVKYYDDIINLIEAESYRLGKRIVNYWVLPNEFWKIIFASHGYLIQKINSKKYYLTVKVHHHGQKYLDILYNSNHWVIMSGDIF